MDNAARSKGGNKYRVEPETSGDNGISLSNFRRLQIGIRAISKVGNRQHHGNNDNVLKNEDS